MGYAIGFTFDKSSETAVRAMWQWLARNNYSLSMLESSAPPHISLTVYDDAVKPSTLTKLEKIAATLKPFTLTLQSMEVFTDTRVLYLAPLPSPYLYSIHERCHLEFIRRQRYLWPQYDPERWVPHCSLAVNMADVSESVIRPIRKHIQTLLPLSLTINHLALTQFYPVETIKLIPLGKSSEQQCGPDIIQQVQ